MASKPIDPTKQRTNYARICWAVIELCRDALWDILIQIGEISAKDLPREIVNNHSLLVRLFEDVKKKFESLNKDNMVPTKTDVDCTSLYAILRNICQNIEPPANGWGKKPSSGDENIADDIERIRIMRNECFHAKEAQLSDQDYDDCYTQLADIMKRFESRLNNVEYSECLEKIANYDMDLETANKYIDEVKRITAKLEKDLEAQSDEMQKGFQAVDRKQDSVQKDIGTMDKKRDAQRDEMQKGFQAVERKQDSVQKDIGAMDKKIDAERDEMQKGFQAVERKQDSVQKDIGAMDKKIDAQRDEMQKGFQAVDRKQDSVQKDIGAVDKKIDGHYGELMDRLENVQNGQAITQSTVATIAKRVQGLVEKGKDTTQGGEKHQEQQRLLQQTLNSKLLMHMSLTELNKESGKEEMDCQHEGSEASEDGLVQNVICLDTSESMANNDAWSKAKTFVEDYLNGLENWKVQHNVRENNVALVTFGHETKIMQTLTNEFRKIRLAFKNIKLGGPTPMFGGLTLAMAAAECGKCTAIAGTKLPRKIILITDGEPTEGNLYAGPDEVKADKREETHTAMYEKVQMLGGISTDLICVHVGTTNREFLQQLVNKAHGKQVSFDQGVRLATGGSYSRETLATPMAECGPLGGEGLHIGGDVYESLPTLMAHLGKSLTDLRGQMAETLPDMMAKRDNLKGNMMPMEGNDILPSMMAQICNPLSFGGGLMSIGEDETLLSLNSKLEQALSDLDEQIKRTDDLDDDTKRLLGELIKTQTDMQSNGVNLLPIGSRVIRGPEWNENDTDGQNVGTVIDCIFETRQLLVQWDESESIKLCNYYRDNFEVLPATDPEIPRILPAGVKIAVGCAVKPGPHWDASNTDVETNQKGTVITVYPSNRVQVYWKNEKRGIYSYNGEDNNQIELIVMSSRQKRENDKDA